MLIKRDKLELFRWYATTVFPSPFSVAKFRVLVQDVIDNQGTEFENLKITHLYETVRVYHMSQKYNQPEWKIWERIEAVKLTAWESKFLWAVNHLPEIESRCDVSFYARDIVLGVAARLYWHVDKRDKLSLIESIDEYRRLYEG